MTDPKKTPEETEAEEKANADAAAKAAEEKKPAGRYSTKKLASYVHIDGHAYGPGDKIPADVAERITNPKAWA